METFMTNRVETKAKDNVNQNKGNERSAKEARFDMELGKPPARESWRGVSQETYKLWSSTAAQRSIQDAMENLGVKMYPWPVPLYRLNNSNQSVLNFDTKIARLTPELYLSDRALQHIWIGARMPCRRLHVWVADASIQAPQLRSISVRTLQMIDISCHACAWIAGQA